MGLLARKPVERSSYLRGAEHRQEAQERVEANLDPWEIPMWRKHRYAKGPNGKLLFTGTPDHKAMRFREWLEAHEREATGQRARAAEEATARAVRAREKRAVVATPCRTPFRFRTKAACNPEARQPKWTRSTLLRAGRSVEVPCGPPDRYRNKELCDPKARWRAPPPPLVEEPVHAFEGLI